MENTLGFLLAGLSAVLLVNATRLVVGFNRRMPELWRLLETTGRSNRVQTLRDSAKTNLPAARYLYDRVDFEDDEIRAVKLALRNAHRLAISNRLLFMVSVTASLVAFL